MYQLPKCTCSVTLKAKCLPACVIISSFVVFVIIVLKVNESRYKQCGVTPYF